jgi:hypothetical protein
MRKVHDPVDLGRDFFGKKHVAYKVTIRQVPP